MLWFILWVQGFWGSGLLRFRLCRAVKVWILGALEFLGLRVLRIYVRSSMSFFVVLGFQRLLRFLRVKVWGFGVVLDC